jgi:hypothetical protein
LQLIGPCLLLKLLCNCGTIVRSCITLVLFVACSCLRTTRPREGEWEEEEDGYFKISSNCSSDGLYAWLLRVTASTRLPIKYSVLSPTSLSTTGLPSRMSASMGMGNTYIIIDTTNVDKYFKLTAQLT